MVKAKATDIDVAHEIFYRASRKLYSEGRDTHFGGMSEEDVARSIEGDNRVYLFYRNHNELPVAVISVLHEVPKGYEEVLKGVPEENSVVLNAVAVRPELWGQGFARQAVDICLKKLQEEGIKAVVGTVCPDNTGSAKTFQRVCCRERELVMGEAFERTTPKGRLLKRRRFAVIF